MLTSYTDGRITFAATDGVCRHTHVYTDKLIHCSKPCSWYSMKRAQRPVLRQLHWQPVWQHTEFKLAILIYKAVEDCQLTNTASHQRLQLSNVAMWEVPRTCTGLGDQSFTVFGLHIWKTYLATYVFWTYPLEFCILLSTVLQSSDYCF